MKKKKLLVIGVILLIVGICGLQFFSGDGYDAISGIIIGIGIGILFTGIRK